MSDPRFPLGVPTNRPNPADPTPVAGRPGWWRDKHGVERYIEQKKPRIQGEINLSLSRRLLAAGYTRRPSWRSLPSDE